MLVMLREKFDESVEWNCKYKVTINNILYIIYHTVYNIYIYLQVHLLIPLLWPTVPSLGLHSTS